MCCLWLMYCFTIIFPFMQKNIPLKKVEYLFNLFLYSYYKWVLTQMCRCRTFFYLMYSLLIPTCKLYKYTVNEHFYVKTPITRLPIVDHEEVLPPGVLDDSAF